MTARCKLDLAARPFDFPFVSCSIPALPGSRAAAGEPLPTDALGAAAEEVEVEVRCDGTMSGVARGGGGHYDMQEDGGEVMSCGKRCVNSETYAATRLIKVQRSPRRILAFKSDDMVLEKLEPMEKRNRRRRNCKMNKSVMSQNGFCVGAIRTVPHSQV